VNICFVPRNRMRYVGTNKYLRNIIYASLGTDGHMYFQSGNPQFLYLEKVRMSAVFEDFEEAAELSCDTSGDGTACDPLEADFPIREYLVPTLIELVEKEVLGVAYRPRDNQNNANDDLSDLMGFIRRSMKNSIQQQMEG